MIDYSVNSWGFSSHVCQLRGSVIPKALAWAIPTAALAGAIWYFQNEYIEPEVSLQVRRAAASNILAGFSGTLGFLLVFRTQKAYGRYWECAMYLQKARGEWFNATSNLVSFCSTKPEKAHEVKKFQHQIVRLISLLFRSAIGEVSCVTTEFEVLNPLMDEDSLQFLCSKPERCEVVMQWIQRLVVDNIRSNNIEIAPPIVSRVFQEFSLGIVNIASAKKITIIPFPFPYSQMMQVLLMFQAIFVPVITGYGFHKWWVASGTTFVVVLLAWCIHFTACEIEMPFGDDANDLPLGEFVLSMNDSLCNLLQEKSQVVPLMHIKGSKLYDTFNEKDRIPWNPNKPDLSHLDFAQRDSDSAFEEGCLLDEHTLKVNDGLPPVPIAQAPIAAPLAAPPGIHPRSAPAPAGLPPQTVPMSIPIATHSMSPGVNGSDAQMFGQLAQLSHRIEGHLVQMIHNLGSFPRIEERIDKISSEVGQIGVASLMFVERMDRLDKATAIGRPPAGEMNSSQVWFVGERGVGERRPPGQDERRAHFVATPEPEPQLIESQPEMAMGSALSRKMSFPDFA